MKWNLMWKSKMTHEEIKVDWTSSLLRQWLQTWRKHVHDVLVTHSLPVKN